ncbi:MAG: hypothetical protein K0R18_308 [Bacillales bacterium]|jgi:hypothetical protein|nr:hypothetical protein [Bacillales bacterium]
MKVVGFFIDGNSVVSPSVFRMIAINKLSKLGFNMKEVIKPGVKERSDIIKMKEDGKSAERAKAFLRGEIELSEKIL